MFVKGVIITKKRWPSTIPTGPIQWLVYLNFDMTRDLDAARIDSELLPLYNKDDYLESYPEQLKLSATSQQILSPHDLALHRFQNVIKTEKYGIHDFLGRPIIPSFLRRGDGNKPGDYPYGVPMQIETQNHYVSSPVDNIDLAFYVNYLNFAHFGHLMTECISSIYPLLYWRNNINEFTIIVDKEFKEFYHHLAKILGISANKIKVPGVNCSLLFIKTLLIPRPTMINRNMVSKSHSIVVKKYLETVYDQKKFLIKKIATKIFL